MHWADEIAKTIISSGKFQPYWVDDMKTPSGFAHVGSLMGPVIHSAVYRALKDLGHDGKFTFVINDLDPVDGLSDDIKDDFSKYLGFPLKNAPSPDPKFKSMADYYAHDFTTAFQSIGVEAKIVSSWDMYTQGKFDEVIRIALDNAEKIQDIYRKVSGSKKKESGWLPFQVICEKCGKLGTTKVTNWDGEKVTYSCEKSMVVWAEGCGHMGHISPFGGTGKLPWKVDWAAHWKVMGVTIEGAGKDHGSAGGSYDIALTICKEVFKYTPPHKFVYEFLLIGGKKMSSSKGVGLKAHDLVDILPPSVGRFLIINTDIKKQTNFDPMGTMAIPDLFDAYDKAWEEGSRTYVLSQIDYDKSLRPVGPTARKGFFAPRFKDIATYLSQGYEEGEVKAKLTETQGGKLDDTEIDVLEERIEYARTWLNNYAPEEYRFEITVDLPDQIKQLTSEQKNYLSKISPLMSDGTDPATLQISLYELAKEVGLPPKDAFSTIYISFLGKSHGPRAGMLLSKLGKEKVIERISEVISFKSEGEKVEVVAGKDFKFDTLEDREIFFFSPEFSRQYPSATVGLAVIKGITVKSSDSKLEDLKKSELKALLDYSIEELESTPEISSYRRMYKDMGVDWAKKKSSPVALLRRVIQGKGLYSVNTCVDAYNLVVMKHRISAGAFDLDKMKLPMVLDVAKGGEQALYIGDKEPTIIVKGEVCYFDRVGPYNLDYNYRDSIRTSVTDNTKNIVINTEGVYDITREQVEWTLDEVIKNIIRFCGGKLEMSGIVLVGGDN